MALKKVSILGVSVTTSSRQDILSYVKQKISAIRNPHSIIRIVTPNPEQIVFAQTNEEFRRILNDADVALPDGVGVVWAMKKKSSVIPAKAGIQLDHGIPARSASRRIGWNDKKIERISGVDFMVDLCRVAAEKNKRVLFYGGRNGVSRRALAAVKQQIPGLDGLAEDAPILEIPNIKSQIPNKIQILNNSNKEDVIQHLVQLIRSRNIDMVFIGLGAPKQEFVGEALSQALSNAHCPMSLILMSVGGSFDMLAGNVKRAPKIVQTMGFEWFWRLVQEPWRWRRQCSLVQFFWLVITGNKSL